MGGGGRGGSCISLRNDLDNVIEVKQINFGYCYVIEHSSTWTDSYILHELDLQSTGGSNQDFYSSTRSKDGVLLGYCVHNPSSTGSSSSADSDETSVDSSSEEQDQAWPDGKYCVLGRPGKCPDDMLQGY